MNKIIITGASSAIGRKIIIKIDKKNQFIIAHYNESKNFLTFLRKNKFKSKIIPIKCNFIKKSDVNKFIKKTKNFKPDCILHLASKRIKTKRFNNLLFKDFNSEINLSFKSIFEILQIHIPNMLKKKSAKVIFMLSSVSYGVPTPYLTQYVCLKYMLLGLLKSLSSEYKKSNISFIAISPSMMDTPFLKNLDKKFVELNRFLSPSKKFIKLERAVSKIKSIMYSNSKNLNGFNVKINR